MGFYLPIETPRVCTECPCYNNEGFVWCQADTEGHSAALGKTEEIPDWCPAVEVPTPHGRLIDADTLDRAAQKEWDDNEITSGEWVRARERIRNVRTVIEREE